MPRKPVVGQLETRMSEISEPHKPTSLPASRVPGHVTPEARLTRGGTRWCATCNTALEPLAKSTFCGKCRAFRDAWQHRQKRLLKEGVITIQWATNDEIVNAAEHLEAVSRQLITARAKEKPDLEKIDALIDRMCLQSIAFTGFVRDNLYSQKPG